MSQQVFIEKYLVEKGANIHAKDEYSVRVASKYGHLKVVKYLVEKGGNIHADDENAVGGQVRHEKFTLK